jgi:hypothetical protein
MTLFGATLLSAIATAVLAVGAIVTGVLAYLAFRKQSQEVAAQSEQLELQRRQFERDQAERRRAQAVQVFMWETREESWITFHVRNTSRQPVFDLRFEWHVPIRGPEEYGFDWRKEPLMPGEEYTSTRPPPVAAFEPGLEAIFRDSAGVWWRIPLKGQPEEMLLAPQQPPDADGAPATEIAPDVGEQAP